MILRPGSDLLGRDREWGVLEGFLAGPGRLAIVYGRRLVGKTHLTSRLAAARGGLYFCAGQTTSAENLADLSRAVSAWRTEPVTYRSWTDAFEDLLAGPSDRLFVFDEIGYATESEPSIPSLLQRIVDKDRRRGPHLVLCGSTMQAIRALTAPGAPLRGRAIVELVLEPFDYRTAAEFWQIRNPAVAALTWSVVGGLPGYRELCNDRAPRSVADIGRWISAHILEPSAPLHREGRTLLLEEPRVAESAAHWQVLAAVASGCSSRKAIAAAVGRPTTSLGSSLDALCSAGFVRRDDDALHDNGAHYAVGEPILRSWRYLAEPVQRSGLALRPDRRFDAVEAGFYAHVVGPAFEQQARYWLGQYASEETVGGRPSVIAPATVGRKRREDGENQLDLVAVERDASGRRTVLAIGEAKHRSRPCSVQELERLRSLRARLAADCRLILVSAAGFDRAVQREAQRHDDIELVDLDRLYFGE